MKQYREYLNFRIDIFKENGKISSITDKLNIAAVLFSYKAESYFHTYCFAVLKVKMI